MTPSEQRDQHRLRWSDLDLYDKFEHAVVLILTALIAVVVASAVWSLVPIFRATMATREPQRR